MNIQVINPIFSKVSSAEDAKIISQMLFVKSTFWKEGPFSKKEVQTTKPLIKKGIFLTGFIPRIKNLCEIRKIPFESELLGFEEGNSNIKVDFSKIALPDNIQLSQEQIEALQNMLINWRGVIHYPTGSGKTIIFLTFISLFPNYNSLIIVNTKDLLLQTKERAEQMFPGEVGTIGDGEINPNRITIATIQTLKDLDLSEFGKQIQIVICDECHHISNFSLPFVRSKKEEGSYAKVLSNLQAPIRFGFTGTLPYIETAKMALEGYIGPIIASKKSVDIQRLAKVKIKLKQIPITESIRDKKLPYKEIYKMGIVFNSRRNKVILEDAIKQVEEGKTCLILVTTIQHGKNILKMANESFPNLKITFVWSGISGKDRNEIRKIFNEGKYEVVIADAVWREGVDIPMLGSIINAAGGKSEIATIQNIGRGMRRVEGVKEEIILIDYFDNSHRFLRDHFAERLVLYFSMRWIGE